MNYISKIFFNTIKMYTIAEHPVLQALYLTPFLQRITLKYYRRNYNYFMGGNFICPFCKTDAAVHAFHVLKEYKSVPLTKINAHHGDDHGLRIGMNSHDLDYICTCRACSSETYLRDEVIAVITIATLVPPDLDEETHND